MNKRFEIQMSNTLLPSIKIKGFFMDPSFYNVGWLMGLEPTTTGITIRDSTPELQPPPVKRVRPARGRASFARRLPGSGAPDRTRTCYPRLRRPVLYPDELRAEGFWRNG